jgi:type I restriction enzyme M protein
MNKQQLANKIWESANKMRSKIESNEYKDYILGFIFYKYLSEKELKFLIENDFEESDIIKLTEKDTEAVDFISQKIGYFISYENLFSTWLKKGKDFDVSNVRDALSAFGRLINPTHKKVYDGVFNTLETGLSKLGDNSGSQTKAISNLIHLIKDIPMDGKQGYDVLGFIYEYLISMFAANAGKKAGEFYTPHEVSVLMSEIVADHLKDRNEIKIFDPTSGSGSLLINIGQSISKHIDNKNNIKYFAQELKQNTYNLTRMNLIMRGIIPDNIVTRNADTLEDDWPYFDESNPSETYEPLYVDAVVSNPPYSQNWDSTDKETDPRYAGFGLAPKSKADYAFLLHDLYHLKPDGIMTIVLPHGVLFRGGEEGEIRKNLIEKNHIDAIIGLPANLFFGTGIPTIILVLKQKRENTDILIVDASKGFTKEGKNNKLRASDIKKIADSVILRENIDKYSRSVSKEEIRDNEYNLNIPRYVDSSEETEKWDIYSSMFGGIPENEINELNKYWKAFPNLKNDLFKKCDGPYFELKTKDTKETIKNCTDIKSYTENYEKTFEDFKNFLKSELIENIDSINISQEESIIGNDVFNRLKTVPLIDKYEAYQIIDDNWLQIAMDLEVIKTESFEAVKQVDPNMVKKNGKDKEVQDGWIGHIIPFDLIQNSILKEQSDVLNEKNLRLSEISSEYDEILESLSEDDNESDGDDNESDGDDDEKKGLTSKDVKKKAKEIRTNQKKGIKYDEESLELKVVKVDNLYEKEKLLKSKVKKESEQLIKATKEAIENLTDEQAYEMLELKWINPLVLGLEKLTNEEFNKLTDKIKILSEKYSTTYFDLEKEIKETEHSLSEMIDDLVGSEYDMKALKAFQDLLDGE